MGSGWEWICFARLTLKYESPVRKLPCHTLQYLKSLLYITLPYLPYPTTPYHTLCYPMCWNWAHGSLQALSATVAGHNHGPMSLTHVRVRRWQACLRTEGDRWDLCTSNRRAVEDATENEFADSQCNFNVIPYKLNTCNMQFQCNYIQTAYIHYVISM